MTLLFKKFVPVFVLLSLFSSIVLMGSVPPVSRDALTHHLAVPLLYVQKGHIHELPDIIPSYYPQLLDLIYCIPLMFENDIVPTYIHFAFALLTAFLIFLYLQKRLNRFYGLLGGLFFLSLPVIVKLSVTVYVDLGLIFFSTTSLVCLIKWQETQFRFRWLVFSAVCCGFALSTKYNGLITYFLLSAFTPLVYLNGRKIASSAIGGTGHARLFQKKKSRQVNAVAYGFCFMMIAAAVFSPWMIKNYVWTQNPVYPLYDHYFNPEPEPDNDTLDSKPGINHFLIRKYVYKESWFETLTIPLRIFFQGEDDNPKYFDGRLNPLLFFLPLCAFFFPGKKSTKDHFNKKVLLSFSVLYILIVFFQQDMRIRWIGPATPPLVILSAHGLNNLFGYVTPSKTGMPRNFFDAFHMKKFFLSILILSLASLNVVYIHQLFKKVDPLPYLTGQVTRSAYIERFRPEYGILEFANNNLKGKIKILAFFLGNRRYYSHHEISFDDAGFKHLVLTSKSTEDIYKGLKASGYTNLIINYPEFNAWVDRAFETGEKRGVQEFFNQYTQKIFSKNDHGLYQLILP